jgi:hypothetical protein
MTLPFMRPDVLAQSAMRHTLALKKKEFRMAKKRYQKINRLKALPAVKVVKINSNYKNPITLNRIPAGVVIYEIRDSRTGRVDYLDKYSFWRLMPKNIKNNYNLLMADPRRPLFKNPLTRTNVKTRNIQRAVARPKRKTPTRSAAANKIKTAIKKHISKKKKARKSH